MEDIISENKTSTIVSDEFFTYGKRLCESIGRGLFGILKMHAIVGAIPEESFESGEVKGRRNDENLPNSREHEHRDGIIDHGLIIDRHELLADALGDGI